MEGMVKYGPIGIQFCMWFKIYAIYVVGPHCGRTYKWQLDEIMDRFE